MPHRSFWLQQSWAGETEFDATRKIATPSLTGDTRADVAIIGGGYVGLWTALRIEELSPSCDVVILERDICGGGASGRNGGFVLSWWPKFSSMLKVFGGDEAVRLVGIA